MTVIRKFLDWEKGLRQHAKEADARGNIMKEEQLSTRKETKAQAATTKAEKHRSKELKKYGNLDAVLSEPEREKKLNDEVRRFMGWGSKYRIESRGTTWAQLVDPAGDPIGTMGTVMALGTLGLSLLTAPTRRGRDNDKRLYIEVHPNGMIERSGTLLNGGKDYSHVPRQ